MEFFKLMWTDQIIRHLVIMTNKAIVAQGKKKVSQDEMRKYFGHLSVLGVYELSSQDDLWNTSDNHFDYVEKESELSRDH
mgnify:FL=1